MQESTNSTPEIATVSQDLVRSVALRWTPEIAEAGWTPISNLFLNNYHQLDIRPVEALFIIHLMSFKWDKRSPFPRIKTLADQMGVTPSAVRSYARSLEQKGLLKRKARIGSANRFVLEPLFDVLNTLVSKRPFPKAQELERDLESVFPTPAASSRTIFQRDDGKWVSKQTGSSRVGTVHDTKEQALQSARKLLRGKRDAEIMVMERQTPIRASVSHAA